MSRLKFIYFFLSNKKENLISMETISKEYNGFTFCVWFVLSPRFFLFYPFFFFSRAIIFYLTTTISAVVLGIILVTTIRPGDIGSGDSLKTNTTSSKESKKVYTTDTLLDLIR